MYFPDGFEVGDVAGGARVVAPVEVPDPGVDDGAVVPDGAYVALGMPFISAVGSLLRRSLQGRPGMLNRTLSLEPAL